ncbi:unnamed protein product [Notodromas monacha]|uniref:6-phosphogluconate dehydrogenase, decarboxylating n=1 Tax=Notodromas monacha TaxID=399045 RepID=A0A7R9GHS5_9CRUS|nr:unnamed protein product [Notodromas monacha]CAG0923213.1 unnamed protein product [Notodromas monacha]
MGAAAGKIKEACREGKAGPEAETADLALIGLAVMGQNLIMNMNDNKFVVCAFNRTVEKVERFLENEAKDSNVIGATSLKDMVTKLKKPRKVMMLVKAGSAVDDFIEELIPLLDSGDVIIDGGNSDYHDSIRRSKYLEEKGLLFVGTGVSGGEEGARYGPSLMPGGNPKAWPLIKDIFQVKIRWWMRRTISKKKNVPFPFCLLLLLILLHSLNCGVRKKGGGATAAAYGAFDREALPPPLETLRTEKSLSGKWWVFELITGIFVWLQGIAAKADGEPCCDWVGEDGAGHFVKMVHNGIEYGDMQLICEAYHLMRDGMGMNNDEMSEVLTDWNKSELDSFLIEITANILNYKDASGEYLVEKIRDTAGQKGTGKWTAISSLELGTPVTLIGESVFARCLSSLKDDRQLASKILEGPTQEFTGNRDEFVEHIRKASALYASKIVSYAQGFMLLREAAKEYNWNLNYGGIALMWRGGCIIRSVFLGNIKTAFDKDPTLTNLLLDDFFKTAIHSCQESWREVVASAVKLGVPVPAFSAALSFYDGFRREKLPANLIQAQRDYFGAHTYELLSEPGKFVHTNWTGKGGEISSTAYNA